MAMASLPRASWWAASSRSATRWSAATLVVIVSGFRLRRRRRIQEYFDVFSDPHTSNAWLVVTTMVTAPRCLVEPLAMHAHFKKRPNASGGCDAER